MRSMVMEFPEDRTCVFLDKQYMLGSSLLVSPVMNEESLAEYYLPEGLWTNFFTGETREGGKWYSEKIGYCDIPLWVRPNSVIPVGSCQSGPVYDYADHVTLQVYQLEEGMEKNVRIVGTDGEEEQRYCLKREGEGLRVETDGKKPYQVRISGSICTEETFTGSADIRNGKE